MLKFKEISKFLKICLAVFGLCSILSSCSAVRSMQSNDETRQVNWSSFSADGNSYGIRESKNDPEKNSGFLQPHYINKANSYRIETKPAPDESSKNALVEDTSYSKTMFACMIFPFLVLLLWKRPAGRTWFDGFLKFIILIICYLRYSKTQQERASRNSEQGSSGSGRSNNSNSGRTYSSSNNNNNNNNSSSSDKNSHLNASSAHDAYSILGLRENASFKQIKEAYRKFMIKNHPDKFINAAQSIRNKMNEQAMKVNIAYEELKKKFT